MKYIENIAYVCNKFAMTLEANKDMNADWFVRKIGEMYKIEAECVLKRLSPHEIRKVNHRCSVRQVP